MPSEKRINYLNVTDSLKNEMDIIKFIRLARKREVGLAEKDYGNYLNFQEFQAKEILRELKKREIDLSKMRVLELAVSVAGYSLIFKKNSKELIINDVRDPQILKLDPHLNFKKFDVTERYPFKDNSFDFIFCCSLIEHVEKPEKMLSEIKRVLKPSGYLYLSFPPFYTPLGGHYFKPFHLLGERISLKIANFLKKGNIKSYATLHDRDNVLYVLHKRTIKGVKKLLENNKFKIRDIWTRFSFINVAKIPLLNEFLTWHVCFLCKNEK